MAILLLFGFIGCMTVTEVVTEEQLEKSMEDAGAENVDVDINDGGKEMTIKTTTDDGDAEVTVKSDIKNTDEWCAAGSNWNYAATTDEGNANAEWNIVGLMTSGEYDGLCHVVYEGTGPTGEKSTMDYYFSEDGESGYFEMNVGGQVIKQEWNS